MSQSCNIAE